MYIALLVLLVLAGVLVSLLRFKQEQKEQQLAVLFRDLPAEEAPATFFDKGIAKRSRWVRLDLDGLMQLSLTDGKPKEVVLNLFPDLEVTALITDNVTHWNGDQAAYGFIDENPESMFVMSRHKDVMMGLVVLPDARQVLISCEKGDPEGNKYVIVEIDPTKGGACGTCQSAIDIVRPSENKPDQEALNRPANGRKVSSSSRGAANALARQLAKRNDGARQLLEQQSEDCNSCKPPVSATPVIPQSSVVPPDTPLPVPPLMLASLNLPPVLAANRWRMRQTSGGATKRQAVDRPTRGGPISLRSSDVEFIDVLFLYESSLLTALGGNATILQARVDLLLDTLNGIYTSCGINLAVRQAGNCTLAEGRAWRGDGGVGIGNATAAPIGQLDGAYPSAGPHWTEVQAPIRPDAFGTNPPVKSFALSTAQVGIYLPTYAEPNASSNTFEGYLSWMDDRRNSLLYGSQYWGFLPGAVPSDRWGFHDTKGGGGGSDNVYPPMENVPKFTVFRQQPNRDGVGGHIFHHNNNPGHKVGPVDRYDSISTIQAEAVNPSPYAGSRSHDVRFYRYDASGFDVASGKYLGHGRPWATTNPNTGYGGLSSMSNSTTDQATWVEGAWGKSFNGMASPTPHNGRVGMRMDLNGTDYDGNSFIGNPNETRWVARYPVLHGQEGDTLDPLVFGMGPGKDVRADIVCLLASDSLTPAGTSGMSFPYRNIRPVNTPARTIGRGPYPKPNKIDELEFIRHDGEIADVGSQPFQVTFQNLKPVSANNNGTASGLVAYYPFTGNANDASDRKNHGTLNGATLSVDRHGKANRSCSFDGVDDRVDITVSNTLGLNLDVTISAWVKPTDFNHQDYPFIFSATQGSATRALALSGRGPVYGADKGKSHFYVNSDSPSQVLSGMLPLDEWTFIAAVYDGTQYKIYQNGALMGNDISVAGGTISALDTLTIGSSLVGPVAQQPWKGDIDDVRVYNRALSEDDIRGLYVSERVNTTVDTTGLILDYPFETASLADKSGLANNGVAGTGTMAPAPKFDRHGLSNGTLEFDGSDDFIYTQTANGFPGTTSAFTMSMWANVHDIIGPDGAKDIIVTTQGSRDPVIKKNDGTGSFPGGDYTLDNTGGGTAFSSVITIDIDLDGDKDIIIANADSTTSGPTRLFRNHGNNTFAAGVSLPGGNRNTTSLVSLDLNGDNWPDLAQGNYNDLNYVYYNDGTGNFPIIPAPNLSPAPVSATDTNNTMALDAVEVKGTFQFAPLNFAATKKPVQGLGRLAPAADRGGGLAANNPPKSFAPKAPEPAPDAQPKSKQRVDVPDGPVQIPEHGPIPGVQLYHPLRVAGKVIRPTYTERQATWQGMRYGGDRKWPEQAARRFLRTSARSLGIKQGKEDLKTIHVKRGPGTAHVAFQALHKGRPIHGSLLSVHQGPNGMIHTLHARHFANSRVSPGHDGPEKVAAVVAVVRANLAMGVKKPGKIDTTELVWFPKKDGTLLTAWKLNHSTADPPGMWESLVDAMSGEVLQTHSTIKTVDGTGMAFVPNPVQRDGTVGALADNNDANSTQLTSLRQTVPLLSLDGTGSLNGPYAIMNGAASAAPNPAGFGTTIPSGTWNHAFSAAVPPVYNYGRADKEFEEVSIYHAIDSVQRYIQSLGFPNFCNRPLNICAHAFQGFNAYATSGFQLHFGDGANPGGGGGTNSGVDLSEDMDVVVHEYGHSCIFDVQPGWGMNDTQGVHEGGAMHEGFGDYLALSFYGEKGNATYLSVPSQKAALGEWSLISAAGLRNAENTKDYNADWDPMNEVHNNGEIWMGALWDLRKLLVIKYGVPLGPQICDALVFEALMAAPSPNCTFKQMAQEIFKADQLLNNGDNLAEIILIFEGRGIATSGDFPAITGFPDLVAGNFGERNVGYQNTIGAFAAGVELGTATDNTYAVRLVDMTQDDYPDLIVGNDGQNFLYVNAGNGTFQVSDLRNIEADTHDTRAIALGDVNGDGRLDLVAGNFGQVNRWYANDGTPDPFKVGTGSDARPDTLNTTSIELVDMNGDGRLDLVTGNAGFGTQVSVNDGTGNFAVPDTVATGDTRIVHVEDLVGDSRRVLFANGANGDFEMQLVNTSAMPREAKLEFYLGGAAMSSPTIGTSAHLSWNRTQWYNIAVRRTGNTLTLWRDGQEVATSTTTAIISALTSEMPLMLGKRTSFPAYPLQGRLDDIRFYSRALTDAEMQQLFADGWELPTTDVSDLDNGLIHHYPILSTHTPQVLVDIVGGADGSAQNGATSATGRNGAADLSGGYSVDGTQNVGPGRYQFLNLTVWRDTNPTPQPYSFGTGNYTVAMWVQNVSLPPGGGAEAALIGSKKPTGTTGNTWRIGVNAAGRLVHTQGVNATVSNRDSDLPLNDTTWHQVLVTRDATGKVDLYVDGKLVGGAMGQNIDLNSTDSVWVGQRTTDRLKAVVDGIRVYDRSFEDYEAEALYNKQKATITGTARLEIFLSPDELDLSETLQLQLYSDVDTEVPFFDDTFTGMAREVVTVNTASTTRVSPGRIDVQFDASQNQFAWQDLQGIIKLTPNPSGDPLRPTKVVVDRYRITVNGQQFVYRTDFTPVRTASTNPLARNIMMNRDTSHLMVVKLSRAISLYTFAHEMGHLMGAGHAQGDSIDTTDLAGNPPLMVNNAMIAFSPYANNTQSGGGGAAFVEGPGLEVRDEYLAMGSHFLATGMVGAGNGTVTSHKFCTIMAYTDLVSSSGRVTNGYYTRIPRFSDRNVYWQGKSTGHVPGLFMPLATQKPNEALYLSNVRAHNTICKIVTFYRDDNGSGRDASGWDEPLRVPVPDRSRSPVMSGGGAAGTADNRGGSADQMASNKPRRPNASGSGGDQLGGRSGGRTMSTGGNRLPTGGVRPSGNTKPGPGAGSSGRNTSRPGGIGVRVPVKPPTPINPGKLLPNDDTKGSLAITLKPRPDQSLAGATSGLNRGATRGTGETDAVRTTDNRQAFHGRSVWWHVVVPVDGVYDVIAGTLGSNIDTTLGVLLPGQAIPVVNDNDSRTPGPASRVTMSAVALKAGQRILFVIDGVNGAEGSIKLNVRLKRAATASGGGN